MKISGIAPVDLSTNLLNWNNVAVGNTGGSKSVKLTNNLTTSLVIASIVASGDFSITTNTCGASVLGGDSCAIGISFSPTVVGVLGGELAISDSAYGSPRTVSLTGTGNANGLNSITVTPVNPTIDVGGTQQFTSTGHFNNGSTYDLTASVTWASLTPSVATIDLTGLATGVGAGPTTISGALGAISGSTTLTVHPTGFVATGSMNSRRFAHTATLLNNGKVLVIGGSNGGAVASAELYDPATGTFTLTGSMNFARVYHTATLLNNGKVLVTGGVDHSTYVSSAELYDPATGTFTPTGSMNSARVYHTATLLNNGKVLVAGGNDGSLHGVVASAELYDPATETFTPTGSMNSARAYHTATLLNNGKVLVTGGEWGGVSFASAELYDPATGTFTPTGSLNFARHHHTATLLNNGKVLVIGGNSGPSINALTSAELY